MFASLSGRLNTFLLALLVLLAAAIIGMVATRAGAGSLDPPGPPASTMHTLADTPASWDQVLDSTNGSTGVGPAGSPPVGCNSDRFRCVMVYKTCALPSCTVYPAVLDEETGLVWQRSPTTQFVTHYGAEQLCANDVTGNRFGWRLPTLGELGSVIAADGKSLPAGNPFMNVNVAGYYWTSTLDDESPVTSAWEWSFHDGVAQNVSKSGAVIQHWCVRGATGDD